MKVSKSSLGIQAAVITLLTLSIIFQAYSLVKSFRSITSLSSNLFEMFRPLGCWYFVGGILLAIIILLLYAFRDRVKSPSSFIVILFIAALIMYKLLPKYAYYLPLQREIYHTANILYVFRYHEVNVPGYPSMPDSIGYAIFYANLGLILGLNSSSLIEFLSCFTDMFHLLVVTIVSLAISSSYRKQLGIFVILILSLPIIFMLQINSTYRNGFGSLLMVYIITLMLIFLANRVSSNKSYIVPIALLLASAAISYPGIVPILTLTILLYVTLSLILKSAINIRYPLEEKEALCIVIVANVAWFIWQLSRYPKLYNSLKWYINSLLDLIEGHTTIEALAIRYTTYNYEYSIILTLRTIYALVLIALLDVLTLVMFYCMLRYREVNKKPLLAGAFTLAFSTFILLGAEGNFHFAAIYNIFSLSSSLLAIALVSSNYIAKAREGGSEIKNTDYRFALRVAEFSIVVSFCIFLIGASIVLWPAFKNLMPIELKEIKMFKILADFGSSGIRVGYLGLYGDTMGTAVQYVFANRPDIRVFGIPYLTNHVPDYSILMTARNIVSLESKVKLNKSLEEWLSYYITRLVSQNYNKVTDLGDYYNIYAK